MVAAAVAALALIATPTPVGASDVAYTTSYVAGVTVPPIPAIPLLGPAPATPTVTEAPPVGGWAPFSTLRDGTPARRPCDVPLTVEIVAENATPERAATVAEAVRILVDASRLPITFAGVVDEPFFGPSGSKYQLNTIRIAWVDDWGYGDQFGEAHAPVMSDGSYDPYAAIEFHNAKPAHLRWVLHELGHVAGLAHHEGGTMSKPVASSPGRYESGDLRGLAALGC